MALTEPDAGTNSPGASHLRRGSRQRLAAQRAEDLDLGGADGGQDAGRRPYQEGRGLATPHRRDLALPRRCRARGADAFHHREGGHPLRTGEQRLFRGHAGRGRRADRHAARRLGGAAGRAQYRAHRHHRRPRGRGAARAWSRDRLRQRPPRLRRAANFLLSGPAVSAGPGEGGDRVRRGDEPQGGRPARCGHALRLASEHGQAHRRASRRRGHRARDADHGRHGLCQGDAPGAALRATPAFSASRRSRKR